MTATLKTFWIALAAHDKGTGTHTAGNDSHVAFARTDRSLPSDQNVLAAVRLPRHVIVVAVDRLQFRHEGGNCTRRADGGYDLLHHQMAIPTSVVLRPLDCFHVVIKMLRPFGKISQIAIGQVDEQSLHILSREFDEVAAHSIADSP